MIPATIILDMYASKGVYGYRAPRRSLVAIINDVVSKGQWRRSAEAANVVHDQA